MRTARSRTSGENLFDFFMAQSSQRFEPPQNTGQFNIYEISASGERLSWGKVVVFEPPSLLVMDWHLGRPVSTTVEVRFEWITARLTRVRLEHRGWEELEALGATAERQAYEQGWVLILEQCFAPFITRQEVQ
jgi:hypothetical protein